MSLAVVEIYPICQRCHYGQVLKEWDDYKCQQCSAPHDENGELILPIPAPTVRYAGGWHASNRKLRRR